MGARVSGPRPGLCPRAAMAGGAWTWSLRCGPQLCLSLGCLSLLPVEAPRGRRTGGERQPSGRRSSWGPEGVHAPPGTLLPASGSWRGWGALRPVRPGPEREGGPARGGSAGASCPARADGDGWFFITASQVLPAPCVEILFIP